MPITPTYPGIYIEELPSSTRTITAAPTSITAFVGYTHPFKTNYPNQAIRIFSFADYEREFGGFYQSGILAYPHVPYAVEQFFINGGSDAYVVGLKHQYFDSSGANGVNKGDVKPAILSIGNPGIKFKAREPIDQFPITVTINNLQKGNIDKDTADITIVFGSRSETFRKVTLNNGDKQNYLPNRINGVSTIVKVSDLNDNVPPAVSNFGSTFTAINQVSLAYESPPGADWTTFNPGDFGTVFQQDSALDLVPIFNLLVIPGVSDNSVWSEALSFCEKKQAFLILDPPKNAAANPSSAPLPLIENLMESASIVPKSTNGALYFPYLQSIDPITNNTIEIAPSGFVAGIYARTDLNRGVWKAPAGLETTILNTTGVAERGRMTDQRQGTLNPIGVNCLRSFPGIGTVVYGARTLVSGNTALQQWWYVPVRRMTLFIEQTLIRNLGWVVFEPNDEPLWAAIRLSIEGFMLSLFNQGAFQGSTPSQAFQVKCDKSTTTQQDIDNGIVNIVVAFAPLKPAEFVIIKIAQLAGQVQS